MERLAETREECVPREYKLGKLHVTGADRRCYGNELSRDKVLGREISVTLTNTHVHIKRVPHPDALAAVENDAGKGDSRWKIVSLNENEFRCSICGYV